MCCEILGENFASRFSPTKVKTGQTVAPGWRKTLYFGFLLTIYKEKKRLLVRGHELEWLQFASMWFLTGDDDAMRL